MAKDWPRKCSNGDVSGTGNYGKLSVGKLENRSQPLLAVDDLVDGNALGAYFFIKKERRSWILQEHSIDEIVLIRLIPDAPALVGRT